MSGFSVGTLPKINLEVEIRLNNFKGLLLSSFDI
jgi:hypothetical protein